MDVDKQKRQEELLKRLQEFQSYSKANEIATQDKWRSILSSDYIAKMKDEVQKMHAEFSKTLDQYDAIIERLNTFIREGEEQYQFNERAQKRNLQLLSDLARRRLNDQKAKFDKELQTIVDEYEANRKAAVDGFMKHSEEVRDITGAIENEYEAKKRENESKFNQERDYLQNKHQDNLSNLKAHLNELVSAEIAATRQAYEDFKKASEGKSQQFDAMFEKHKKRQREMRANEEIIIRKAAQIAHLRRKIKNNARESRESNERLRQEKDNLSQHFRELKDIMARFRQNEKIKLQDICVAYEDATSHVTEQLQLAEKILKLAEMARKLETEREQVLPFPKSITESDPEIQRQLQQFKLQLKGDAKYVAESDLFDNFYRRYNKVLLEKLALQRERETLIQRNQELRNMMRKYMTGVAITPDLMDKPNTLFIVNQNTNAPMRKYEQDGITMQNVQQAYNEVHLQTVGVK